MLGEMPYLSFLLKPSFTNPQASLEELIASMVIHNFVFLGGQCDGYLPSRWISEMLWKGLM